MKSHNSCRIKNMSNSEADNGLAKNVGVYYHQSPKKKRNQFPIAQSVLTIHALYNLPREMQQLDSQQERLEIVVRPVVKYNYRERRIAHMQLPESVIPFSPASILFRGGRFVLDLDNREVANASNPKMAPSGSMESFPEKHCSWPADGEDFDMGDGQPKLLAGNRILLEYPSAPGLSTLIEVMICIRQRRLDSLVVRWITSSLNTNTPPNGVGCFSVSTEEVNRKKTVTRIAGLCVGGVVCSVAVNPDDERDTVMRRLVCDKKRYIAKYGVNVLGALDISEMLRSGATEQEIHRHMLLLVDPDHYARRLQSLLALYPSSGNAEWRQGWQQLLSEYATREEELMQRSAMEIGPECCTVFSRHRLLAYRKKYTLSEESICTCMEPFVGNGLSEKLDVEPDEIFAVLTRTFGREPRPASYLFPAQAYAPDMRTFLFEMLHFSTNRLPEKHRDATPISHMKRPPFVLSPCERPLHLGGSFRQPSKPLSEIDILRMKYAPEFAQIVPSVAYALQAVVDRNRHLSQPPSAESSFFIFYQQGLQPQLALQNFVHRTAEYTFISPSSLLGAIIYLDRLCMQHLNLVITERNVLRLFLTSVRVASKILELRSINNRHFANVFGLDTKAMNLLEEVFIKQLHFDLFLSPEEFGGYARLLQPSNPHQFQIPSSPSGHAGAKVLPSYSSYLSSDGARSGLSSKLIPGRRAKNDGSITGSNDSNTHNKVNKITSSGKPGSGDEQPHAMERNGHPVNLSVTGAMRCLRVAPDTEGARSRECSAVMEV